MSKIQRCYFTPTINFDFFEMMAFSVLFTDYNVSFSGFIASVYFYTMWTLMFAIYLIPIEPVFHWVWESYHL